MIRGYELEATTDAVSWEIREHDSFNIQRIDLIFATPPSSAGSVTVTIDSVAGAAYDRVVQTVSAVGATVMVLNPVVGLVSGDKVIVAYSNPDEVSITGYTSTDVRPMTERGGMVFGDGIVRAPNANYRRYYHLSIGSAAPGASGATRVLANNDQRGGWLLDAPAEYLEGHVDVHSDWDGISSPVVELGFTVQTDNTLGTDNDTIIFRVIARYSQPGVAQRTQTVDCEYVVGKAAQYSVWNCEIELDPLATDNPIAAGDGVTLTAYVLDTGTLTQAVVNSISFWYPTSHIGIEQYDV